VTAMGPWLGSASPRTPAPGIQQCFAVICITGDGFAWEGGAAGLALPVASLWHRWLQGHMV